MGLERVLQAAVVVAAIARVGYAEPVGIIDVGPADRGQARALIAGALFDAGLEPWTADGSGAALTGVEMTPDAVQLAEHMSTAEAAFAKLDCSATIASAKQAIGIASARQAAALPVPELATAWSYVLSCADRAGDVAAASTAAARLRAAGGSTTVPAALLDKYPVVDAVLDRQTFKLEIGADVPGAAIWIDGARAGTAPITVYLEAGEHVIAAAKGDRRGFAAGTTSATQTSLVVPTVKQVGKYRSVARRVASWGSETPAASQVKLIMDETRLRAIIVRKGDDLEVWGRAGRGEEPRRLGGEDGVGALDDAPRLAGLIAERVTAWNERAPDPDRELLVETADDRAQRALQRERKKARTDEPTKWWVYGALIGAGVLGGALLYFSETADTVQRVELHAP